MVKPKHLIASLSMLCVLNLNAQTFDGGLIAGFTTSQIDNDNFGGYNKFGLKAGCFVNRQFTKQNCGQLELAYVQKGAAQATLNYSKRLDYAEIACMYKHSFADTSSFWSNFEIEIGLSTDFLVNIDSEVDGLEERNANFADFDLPINVGINYLLSDRLIANLRLSYSTFDLGTYRNNSLNFCLYYTFGK